MVTGWPTTVLLPVSFGMAAVMVLPLRSSMACDKRERGRAWVAPLPPDRGFWKATTQGFYVLKFIPKRSRDGPEQNQVHHTSERESFPHNCPLLPNNTLSGIQVGTYLTLPKSDPYIAANLQARIGKTINILSTMTSHTLIASSSVSLHFMSF